MLKIYSKSDVGLVRTNNEDFHLTDSDNGLVIVADGAGGHDHGEIASRLAVESCYQYLTREDYLQDTPNITQTLMDSISFANQQLIEYKRKNLPNSNMGTTLSCAHIRDGEVCFAWMGDSRIYLLNGKNNTIKQLSTDHTLYQEMLDRGEVGQIFKKSILSRMLGNNPYTRPEGGNLVLIQGSLILVCTDGFSDLVQDEKTLTALDECGNDYSNLPDVLIGLAKGQGGRDNITIAVALNDLEQ